MRIKLCSIHVEDPARAHAFYTGTLGFVEVIAMPEANFFVVGSPEDPEGTALLLEPSDNPVAEHYRKGVHELGLPAIVFGVADVHAEYERLSALGVRFTGAPASDPSGTSATLDDTCGNYVQIHQD